ncbi:MAG: hypothetical protein Q7K25_11485 [Actinomycetota bacterium]|nr:hypothetical protein [Actinomycetota bacterium]
MSARQASLALAICLLSASSLLTACATESEPTPGASPSSTMAGETCDQSAVTQAVQSFYSSTEAVEATGLALQSVASVQCAGDWAVAQIVVGDGAGHNIDDYEVAQRTGADWAVADRMTVCGTWDPKKPAQMPQDVVIDERLYASACTRN